MRKAVCAILSIIAVSFFVSCTANGIALNNITSTDPPNTQTSWIDDSRYHPIVGGVNITCEGASITPLANWYSSTEYRDNGWLCADGRSLMFGTATELMELDRKLPTINCSKELTVNLSGSLGRLAYFRLYDQNHQGIGDRYEPKDEELLILPDDNRICYISLIVGWAAELPPPGEQDVESTGYEYIFKIKQNGGMD